MYLKPNYSGILQSLFERDFLAIGNNIVEFSAAQNEGSNLNPGNTVNSPGCYYRNGVTYQGYMRAELAFQMPSLITYDNKYGVQRPRVIGRPLNLQDTHPYPAIVWDNNQMWMAQENPHASPIQLYKAHNTEDYSAFYKITETFGSQMSYPSFMKYGAGYVSYGREQSTFRAAVYKSTTGMEGWGTEIAITNGIDSGEDGGGRHYVTSIFRNKVGSWYYLEITYRNELNSTWVRKFLLKTQDFNTYYNYTGTFSKTVTTGVSWLSHAELIANCQTHYTGGDAIQGYSPRSCMTPSGKYFCVAGNGKGNHILIYHNGTSFTTKPVSIPDLVDSGDSGVDPLLSQNGPCVLLLCHTDSRFDIIVRRNVGGFFKLFLYNTSDAGDTWNLVGDLFPGVNANLFQCGFPFNFEEVPNSANFAITAWELSTTVNSSVKCWVNRVAFGKLQTETTLTRTPVSSLNDVPGLVRHYKISPGTITNSGTSLLTLIDQSSSGQNATASGSPILDSSITPTQVTFDNTNDIIDVPIAGINDLKYMTLTAVVRKKDTSANNAGIIFSTADTADANSFMTCQIRKDVAFNQALALGYNDGTLQGTQMGDEKASSNTNFVIATFVVTGLSFQIYLNGRLQYFKTTPDVNATARKYIGFFQNQIGSIDNIKIGGLVRNSTSYSDFELKEWAMYDRCVSQDERRGIEQKLATQYGITLANEYA